MARVQSTTTQRVETTTTSTTVPRPAPGLADGVPAPRVNDRGTDYVAIARSLVDYGRWLEWHHPDSALVERAYEQYSDLAKSMKTALVELRSRRERIQEVDRAPLDLKVMSALPRLVSFQLTEQVARRDLVGTNGRRLDHVGAVTEHYILLMMRSYRDSPWRLCVVDHPDSPVEVKL